MSTAIGQVLTLWNETLMVRAGQQVDAMSADLIVEELAGEEEGRETIFQLLHKGQI